MPQTNVLSDWKATYPTDAKCQKPPLTVAQDITAASWTTPNVTFTTAAPTTLGVGGTFSVNGVNPSAYDGSYTAITGTTGTTVIAALAGNPGAYVSGGTLTYGTPLTINLASNAVPNKPTFAAGAPQMVEASMSAEAGEEDEETRQQKTKATIMTTREITREPVEDEEDLPEDDDNDDKSRSVPRHKGKHRR